MLNTPPATAIITLKIISVLAQHWQINSGWWEKCADSYELYLSYLSVACEKSRVVIAICSICKVRFLLNSRAKNNPCYCPFGCRKQNKTEKSRKNKQEQRRRERKKPTVPPSQHTPYTNKNQTFSVSPNSDLMKMIDSLKLTDLAASVTQLVSSVHPDLDKTLAKLCGITAFMSAGMKFCDHCPDWFTDVNVKTLMEVVDEISDG